MTGELQEPKANLCATQTLADVATCSAVSKLTKHTLIAFLFFAVANGTLWKTKNLLLSINQCRWYFAPPYSLLSKQQRHVFQSLKKKD
jgi:hypothetical protein